MFGESSCGFVLFVVLFGDCHHVFCSCSGVDTDCFVRKAAIANKTFVFGERCSGPVLNVGDHNVSNVVADNNVASAVDPLREFERLFSVDPNRTFYDLAQVLILH